MSTSQLLYPDMIYQILQFVDEQERIVQCSTVCRQWRETCQIIPIHYSIQSKTKCKLFRLIPFRINSINVQPENYLNRIDDLKGLFSHHSKICYLEKIELVIGEFKELILQIISCSDHLRKLAELTACDCGIDDECIEKMQQSKLALSLKTLKLRGNSITNIDLSKFPNLTSLYLGQNKLSLDSIRKNFSEMRLDYKLVYLDVSGNGMSNEGLSMISMSKNLNLSTLKIGFNRAISNSSTDHFYFNGMKSSHLTHLDLENLHLNSDCIQSLCSNPLSNLTELNLARNLIGNEGVRHLSNCNQLKSLHTLLLDYNKIGNEGVKHLAHSQNLSNLKLLFLSQNYINDEGANMLAKSNCLRNIVFLDLSENGHISIREALPPSFSFE
ncbi:hypothetical protein NAEGRDRAFT_70103 [Naegleria gruberi]|uniref:F-box domain-containing protein n=1 Tax=Naegleria gruberi TaxID=5762 RepID=D2VME3_NAEGR|nr:uncharacterized protein NAEGRDRAFT_70103 [Naegleria gruberi]EFC42047.1 hypothetical protein NAEGRDRAFT_70103 [Naegleria gruberi]|eukprot:XP_002674791.1 hypothetical protein NAEGRDRAFT_70103 [Naegleria gruberi strain NEG-M]